MEPYLPLISGHVTAHSFSHRGERDGHQECANPESGAGDGIHESAVSVQFPLLSMRRIGEFGALRYAAGA